MKYLKLLLTISIAIVMFACSDDNPVTNALNTSVSVSGAVTESYNGTAWFENTTYTSGGVTLEYFALMIIPTPIGSNTSAMTFMFKAGSTPFAVGTYKVGEYSYGSEIPTDAIGATFSSKTGNMSDVYYCNSGSVSITSASSAKITGTCNLQGYLVFGGITKDTTKKISLTASFVANPMP